MDSITQLVLGAAVAEAAVGKKIGRKASLYGALLGTLPDLDVLWVKNAVDSFTEHRSWSHSIFLLFILAMLLAMAFRRWYPQDFTGRQISYRYWVISIYLIFVTHVTIDWFTTYGTQLLWPFSDFPYAISSVFIIDPVYTIPLLLGLLWTVFSRKQLPVLIGLVCSSCYLLMSLALQFTQTKKFDDFYQQQGIQPKYELTQATPFNILLWRNVAMVEGGYWVSFRSVFDPDDLAIQSRFFVSENDKLNQLPEDDSIMKLQRFTKGFYQVREIDNQLWLSDVRMGGFGRFVFNFIVAERSREQSKLTIPDEILARSFRSDGNHTKRGLQKIFQRITDPEVNLFDLFAGAKLVSFNE